MLIGAFSTFLGYSCLLFYLFFFGFSSSDESLELDNDDESLESLFFLSFFFSNSFLDEILVLFT